MADSSNGGIGRRRLLITSVLLGVCVLITSGLLSLSVPTARTSSWLAEADPGFTPPSDCGSYNDSVTDPRLELWKSVKDHYPPPANPSPNIFVNESWALKDGGQGKIDLLAIPRARVTGVECADIWGPKAFNLWKPAWEEATDRFKGKDVILGINSKPGRKQDQLHIHLSSLQPQAKTQLNALKGIPDKLSKWNTAMFSVMGHVYRIVRVDDLNTNVFKLVKESISQNDMFEQSIAVVAAPGGKGFYILNTQGKPKLSGEPEHKPELHLNKDWGTESIEDLLKRNP
jgi:CDP-diacylglycerol pyrophosphatase